MARLRITITASEGSRGGRLRLQDAMLQVVDLLKLHEDARRAVPTLTEPFVWRLESATANSPFQLVALADPIDPAANVDPYVHAVNRELRTGLENLARHRSPAWWMDPDTIGAANAFFARNENGIGETLIEPEDDEPVRIRPADARAAIQTIEGTDITQIAAVEGGTSAYGELRGVMIQVGRWFKKPAIRVQTDQYGVLWCVLTKEIAERFGSHQSLNDVWAGKTLAVLGRFEFAGDRLMRVYADDVAEVPDVPLIDLDSIVDPDFTLGLDPVEYLRRLHEGELA